MKKFISTRDIPDFNKSAIYIGGAIALPLNRLVTINTIDTFILNEVGEFDGTFYVTCTFDNPEYFPFFTTTKRYKQHFTVGDIIVVEYDVSDLKYLVDAVSLGKYSQIPKVAKDAIIANNSLYYPDIQKMLNFTVHNAIDKAKELNVNADLVIRLGELESISFKEEETLHYNSTRLPKLLFYPEFNPNHNIYDTNERYVTTSV